MSCSLHWDENAKVGSQELPGITSKFNPQEKKCKKAKWFSEDALQKAVKRREA